MWRSPRHKHTQGPGQLAGRGGEPGQQSQRFLGRGRRLPRQSRTAWGHGHCGWRLRSTGTADRFLQAFDPAQVAISHLERLFGPDILVLQRAFPEITGPRALLIFDRAWFQLLRPETTNTDRALLSTHMVLALSAGPAAAACQAPD